MTRDPRLPRRILGLLRARLPELRLDALADPRQRRGRRWKSLPALLRLCVVGMMAGCRSFRELEALSDTLALPLRRELRLGRRVPDTTLRTTLCKLAPDALRRCLYAQVKAAHRRQALAPFGLPFGVVAIDGKHSAIDAWDERYAQKQSHSAGAGAHGVVRTMTCCLVSSRAAACLDASPIPSATNEMGHFPRVLEALQATYGSLDLFRMISADAGMASEANARLVVERHGWDYLFRLNAEQPTLLREAKRLLARRSPDQADAITHDLRGPIEVTRRLYLTTELAGFLDWTHLRTVLRVEVEQVNLTTGQRLALDDDERERYYLSSLDLPSLTPDHWLLLVRRHWTVENQCHHTWDTAFAEDDHPWIVSDKHGAAPKAVVCLMLLRRMTYNMLALFRSVTQRADERRQTPWRTLLRSVYATLIAATEADRLGLRSRAPSVA